MIDLLTLFIYIYFKIIVLRFKYFLFAVCYIAIKKLITSLFKSNSVNAFCSDHSAKTIDRVINSYLDLYKNNVFHGENIVESNRSN